MCYESLKHIPTTLRDFDSMHNHELEYTRVQHMSLGLNFITA